MIATKLLFGGIMAAVILTFVVYLKAGPIVDKVTRAMQDRRWLKKKLAEIRADKVNKDAWDRSQKHLEI